MLAAPKVVAKAPAADFGAAAAACATTLGSDGLDLSKLAGLGWTAIPLRRIPGADKYFAFMRSDGPVRVFLSTSFEPKGQCVVDGFGTSKSQFGAIAGETKKQVGAILGAKLKDTGASYSPGGFSRGQGFLADDLMLLISSENRGEGMSIRITLMRRDPAKSPNAIAMAAGMAAEYLPLAIEGLIVSTAAPAAAPQSTPKP